MLTLHYNCQTIIVAVTGPQSTHDKISKYFHLSNTPTPQTAITLNQVSQEDLWLRLDACEALPAMRQSWGHPSLKYNVYRTGNSDTYIPLRETPHVLRVYGTGDELELSLWAADETTLGRTAVRLMRQLMLRRAEQLGGRDAHGAAIVLNKCGIVMAGLPGAGKSTVALTLAQKYGASLVASDRLVFVPTASGDWTVAGTPVPWRIANGTISGVSKLADAFAGGINLYRGNHLVEDKHELITEELSTILGVSATFETPLDAVVVLRRSYETAVHEVLGTKKLPLLARTLFNQGDRLFVNDWLGKHTLVQDIELARRGRRLAQTVRVFEATWKNYSDIALVASEIADIFGGSCRG